MKSKSSEEQEMAMTHDERVMSGSKFWDPLKRNPMMKTRLLSIVAIFAALCWPLSAAGIQTEYNVAAPMERLSPQPSSDTPSASARPSNIGMCA